MKILLRSILTVAAFLVFNQSAVSGPAEGRAALINGNFEEALLQLRPAAMQGDATAQALLGSMYLNGQGVDKDFGAARSWFEKSAAQSHPEGQHNLGVLYEMGAGVSQSDIEAAKWYRLAAAQAYVRSQYNLGGLYFKTRGQVVDYWEAWRWLNLAAESGAPIAALRFGALHMVHPEQEKNRFVHARMWFLIAAANGLPEAQANLKKIEKFMTPDQLSDSGKLARNWLIVFLNEQSRRKK